MTPGTVSSHRSSPSAMTGFWTLPIMPGPTNALNGDKILHLENQVRVTAGEDLELDLRYGLGKGLGSLKCRVLPLVTLDHPV